jgi:hypothetical protein
MPPMPGAIVPCWRVPNNMTEFEKALALINGTKLPALKADQAGNCIQHALVARDFLRAVGFRAEVKSVAVYVEAYQGDDMLHSVGCGARHLIGHDPNPERMGWDGHLVTVSEGHLIDPTFYQFRRKAWDWIPDVALLKLKARPRETFKFYGASKGCSILAGFVRAAADGYRFRALWMSTPSNTQWSKLPAARLDRRDHIVKEMIEALGCVEATGDEKE